MAQSHNMITNRSDVTSNGPCGSYATILVIAASRAKEYAAPDRFTTCSVGIWSSGERRKAPAICFCLSRYTIDGQPLVLDVETSKCIMWTTRISCYYCMLVRCDTQGDIRFRVGRDETNHPERTPMAGSSMPRWASRFLALAHT